MKTYVIVETREVIKATVTETWTIEAESEEEAVRMVEEREVDADEYDVDVQESEYVNTVILV